MTAAPAPSEERRALVAIGVCAAVLLLAAGWASWAGLRLRALRAAVRKERTSDDLVTARMQDKDFRERLAGALKTLSEDDTPFRTRLAAQARNLGLVVDGQPTQAPPTSLPNLGLVQIDAQLKLKEVSLGRFLDYACAVETQIPDAVLTEAVLKPVPLAGDRWDAVLKVSRRIKPAQ